MLRYAWDGLIFSPLIERYKPGYAPALLKWKPLPTVSFKLRVIVATSSATNEPEALVQLLLTKHEELVFYDWLSDVESLVALALGSGANHQSPETVKKLDGMVVECRWEAASTTVMPMLEAAVPPASGALQLVSRAMRYGAWKAVRVCTDRLVPNPGKYRSIMM
jgi:hypothetical protein